MDVKEDKKPKGALYYIFWVVAGLLLLWFNYDYLHGHLSSNSALINNYIPKYDELERYKLPAVSSLFFAEDNPEQNQDLGYYFGSGYKRSNRMPKFVIVPPVGHKYAAAVTAKTYWELLKFKDTIKNVVILVPVCDKKLKGAALPQVSGLTTKLGYIEYNQDIINMLHADGGFVYRQKLFEEETFWQKQVLFLQKILKDFKIVPIFYGEIDAPDLRGSLNRFMNDSGTIVVFIGDLSAFYNKNGVNSDDGKSAKEEARKDEETQDYAVSCGDAGIRAVLDIAKERRMSSILIDGYSSEGLAENIKNVLGYEAWMSDEKSDEDDLLPTPIEQEARNLKLFVSHYGQDLLKIAYTALDEWVNNGHEYVPQRKAFGDKIFDKGAVFVTIYNLKGEIRGQSGSLIPKQAVALDVISNMRKAANDSRFEKISKEELKDLRISIAFLSDYERLEFNNEQELLDIIIPGVDGIVLRDGNRQGLLLPSMWHGIQNKEEFLQQLKLKAGMSPTYWSNQVKAYRFRTVEIKKDEN